MDEHRTIDSHRSVLTQFREIAGTWTLSSIAVRATIMLGLWLILTEGDLRYWLLATFTTGAATVASLVLVPSSGLGWSLTGWMRFVPFFLVQSVLGGVDVAARALALRPRLDPVYAECQLRIDAEPAQVFVANTMSLMPGTLSVVLQDGQLRLHVLDREMPAVERVREVEELAARMFRLQLGER